MFYRVFLTDKQQILPFKAFVIRISRSVRRGYFTYGFARRADCHDVCGNGFRHFAPSAPPRYTKKQPQPRLFCFWITMLVYSENHFFKVFKNSATGISAQPLLS